MDVLDQRTATGIQVGWRSHNDRRLEGAQIPSHKWWFYDWFRWTVALTSRAADCEPVSVERALYILGAQTANELAPNGSGVELERVLLRGT